MDGRSVNLRDTRDTVGLDRGKVSERCSEGQVRLRANFRVSKRVGKYSAARMKVDQDYPPFPVKKH